MSNSSLPPLPTELWLEIFRFATLTPSVLYLHTTTYHPFQAISTESSLSLSVKIAVSRVCKLWNGLMKDIFYEDITIPPSPHLSEMKDLIRRMDDGSRRNIRMIYLPYSSSTTRAPAYATSIPDINDILSRCSSSLSTIIRPSTFGPPTSTYSLTFEFPAEECPPLPNLKRLDWWHNNEASRTGGINSLSHVLKAAPNLQYLSLGGQLWLRFLECPAPDLPSLTTLRLQRVNVLFIQHICRWSLPSLRNVILETAMTHFTILDVFWERFGAQLRTVELGKTLRFLVDNSVIHSILNGCPNLEELNYYVHFTHTPYPPNEPHGSLTVVGLQCRPPGMQMDCADSLKEHLTAWCHPAYPKLRKILLYETSDIDLDCRAMTQVIDFAQSRGLEVLKVD